MIFVQHYSVEPEKLKKKKESSDKIKSENTTEEWGGYKKELRLNLLELQKGLCAYCENSLCTELGCHIEHIEPQSSNPPLAYEYTNLILSCINSDSLRDAKVKVENGISCGHAKQNKFDADLFIKPTFKDCERYFWYKDNGEIVPNLQLNEDDVSKANYTIDSLRLNCNRLKREREQILVEGYNSILALINKHDALDKFIEQQLSCLENGYLPSYINVRKQHFQIYMTNSTSKINKLAQE